MIPIPSTLYKYLGGGLVLVLFLGGVWLHGRSKGVASMRGEVAEARGKTIVVTQQRDTARVETQTCWDGVALQNDAIASWKHAAEDYRSELDAALARPPRTVYRDVVIESEDCVGAVVEVAGALEEALR